MSAARPPVVPPHPAAKRMTVTYGAFGVVFLLGSAWMFLVGYVAASVLMLVCAFAFSYGGFAFARSARNAQGNNLALQLFTRGRLEEAEALLATLQPARGSVVEGTVAIQRAAIALQRGKPADAIAHATTTLDAPLGLAWRGTKRRNKATARSYRALARVATNDLTGAAEDAQAAEAEPTAAPDAIARARLVRILVASRSGRTEDLAAALHESGATVREWGAPRERAVYRALARMAHARRGSVYREPAKPETPRSALAGFVAALAPEAASFAADVPEVAGTGAMDLPPASLAEVRAIDAVRAKARPRTSQAKKTLALWVVLIVMFLSIWNFLEPAASHGKAPSPPPADSSLPALLIGALVVSIFLAFAIVIVRATRGGDRIAAEARRAVLGDREGARKALWSMVNAQQAMVGASAQQQLALLASGDGALLDVVSLCEAGVTRLATPQLRAAASDLLLPGLLGELAVAKALLGRRDEAAAELTLLARDFAVYPLLASMTLRVRLAIALTAGDLAGAAAVARERTAELPFPYREELLAELAIAATSPTSEEERDRLAGEIADPELARWIDAVSPDLRRRALGGARVATDVAPEPLAEDDASAARAGFVS